MTRGRGLIPKWEKTGADSGGAGTAPKWVYRFTLRRTLEEDCTPFTCATTGRSPSGTEAGTCTAIWYSPGLPGQIAAPTTVAAMLPMVTVTGFATLASGLAGGTIPGVTVGVVAPNPVPHKMIVSPGFAGTVVTPGTMPASPLANVANPVTVTIGNISATVVG